MMGGTSADDGGSVVVKMVYGPLIEAVALKLFKATENEWPPTAL